MTGNFISLPLRRWDARSISEDSLGGGVSCMSMGDLVNHHCRVRDRSMLSKFCYELYL